MSILLIGAKSGNMRMILLGHMTARSQCYPLRCGRIKEKYAQQGRKEGVERDEERGGRRKEGGKEGGTISCKIIKNNLKIKTERPNIVYI